MSDSSWNNHDANPSFEAEGLLNQASDAPEYTLSQGASEIDDSAEGGGEAQPRRLGFTFRGRKKALAESSGMDMETNPRTASDDISAPIDGDDTFDGSGRRKGPRITRQTRIGIAAVLSFLILVGVMIANKAGVFNKKTSGEEAVAADSDGPKKNDKDNASKPPPRQTPVARINVDTPSKLDPKPAETPKEGAQVASETPPKPEDPTAASRTASTEPKESDPKVESEPTPLDPKDTLAALKDESISFPDTGSGDTAKPLSLGSEKDPLTLAAADTEVTPAPKPAEEQKPKDEPAPVSPAPKPAVDLVAAKPETAEPPAQAPPNPVTPPSDATQASVAATPAPTPLEGPSHPTVETPIPPTESPASGSVVQTGVVEPLQTDAPKEPPPATQPSPAVVTEPAAPAPAPAAAEATPPAPTTQSPAPETAQPSTPTTPATVEPQAPTSVSPNPSVDTVVAPAPAPVTTPPPEATPASAATTTPTPAPSAAPATPDPAASALKPVDSPTPTFTPTEPMGEPPVPATPVKAAEPVSNGTSVKIPSIGRNRMIDLDDRRSPEPMVVKEDPTYVDVTPSRSSPVKGAAGGASSAMTATTESEPEAAASMATPHTVQRGENLWTISRLYYGYGWYYKALWAANKETVAAVDKLYVGQTIRIPPPEDLDRAYVESARKEFEADRKARGLASSSRGTGGTATRATPVNVSLRKASRSADLDAGDSRVESGELKVSLPTADPLGHGRDDGESIEAADEDEPTEPVRKRGPRYKIRVYETLRSIARDTLGDSRRSTEIYELNQTVIDDPNHLVTGQIIELPADARVGRKR